MIHLFVFFSSGTLLLSGSDDHRLVITDPFSYRFPIKRRKDLKSNFVNSELVPG